MCIRDRGGEARPCNDFARAHRGLACLRKGARYFYLHETKGADMALVFDVVKAKGKPDDNRRPGTSCPVCDVDGLENIIRRDGDRICCLLYTSSPKWS